MLFKTLSIIEEKIISTAGGSIAFQQLLKWK